MSPKKNKKSGKKKAPGRSAKDPHGNFRTIARNRRATFDYEIQSRHEAGLLLLGTEIKSLRGGKGSIAQGYVRPRNGELWLVGATIPPYEPASSENHEPNRDRKLLLHKREIRTLNEAFGQQGLAIIPLHLYLNRGLAKLEIGVGRGRRRYDKRQVIARRQADRQIRSAVRH